MIEWPPIPLYITFAIVATWGSVLGAELRKEDVNPVEERGLSLLRKLLQWSGLGAAIACGDRALTCAAGDSHGCRGASAAGSWQRCAQ